MGCNKTEDLIHFLVECDQNEEMSQVSGWYGLVQWRCKCNSQSTAFRRSDANLQIYWTGLCIQRRGFSAREYGGSRYGVQKLVITTRGLGLAACDLCYVAASAGVAPPSTPCIASSRSGRGQAECMLEALEGPMRAVQYEYKVTPDMLDAPLSVPILPALIKHIIDAIDVITVGGTTYCLSPRRSSDVVWQRHWFKTHCPIPGRRLDEDDLLKNADEIIPEGYDWKKDLEGDMRAREPGGAHLERDGTLARSAAPRREPLPEYCGRCHPRGTNGEPYYKVADAEMRKWKPCWDRWRCWGGARVRVGRAARAAAGLRGAARRADQVKPRHRQLLDSPDESQSGHAVSPGPRGWRGQEAMKDPEPELVNVRSDRSMYGI
ncbi:hypothetical protein MSG28_001441 [Choristoneura fumiferana]|uniref:Uncharacterized protein n=1 Tax=Choristoneura fumiferana TaxID=7141 RepID=A0ACC0KUN0_CHOFU|nr:hypothetical protein MSG28_001441 [Choristoneura fumiferana]